MIIGLFMKFLKLLLF